jgi:hypothetical protein
LTRLTYNVDADDRSKARKAKNQLIDARLFFDKIKMLCPLTSQAHRSNFQDVSWVVQSPVVTLEEVSSYMYHADRGFLKLEYAIDSRILGIL